MRVLVVLPTYNEAATIERILNRVRGAIPEAEILVVDDSSPDGTAKIAEGAGARLGSVHVLVRPEKNGLGPAYRAGFAWGLARGYEAFVEMDSDFSHDPAALPSLVRAAEAGWRLAELDVPYQPRTGKSKVTGTVRGTVRTVLDMRRVLAN